MPGRDGTEFLVLGPLEVRVDGRAVPLGGAKQRAVLAALSLRAGEVVPVERIVDDVWGDEPPPSAAHTVEGYISRLRQQVEPYGAAIVRRGGGYRLDLDGAQLDAEAAHELLRSATDAYDAGNHERASELASEALGLWRGPALRDAPLHGVGRAEADELDELRLRVVERLVEAELALGRHEDAIPRLRPLVDEHPYRERFVAQLMLALYRSGRPAEALDVYERTRQALDRDLGLRPSVELQRLSGEIVRHDARLARPVPPEAAAPPPPADDEVAPRRRFTRRRAAAAVAVVALAAGVAVAAVGFTRGDGGPPTILPSSVARLDPRTLEPTQVVAIGSRADLVVVAGGYVWITHGVLRYTNGEGLRDAGDRGLTRVDPATGEARSVQGGLAPCGLTPDPSGDVWVANCYTSGLVATVARVDAETTNFEPTWRVPTGPGIFRGMAYGGGSLWVADADEADTRRVTEVDPRAGPRDPIRFDRQPTVLAWSDGYGDLWMDDFDGGSVLRVNAAAGVVEKTYESVAEAAGAFAVDGSAVWVGDWLNPDVVRLPAVGRGSPRHVRLPVLVRDGAAGVTSVAAGAGYIWATTPDDHALWRIDPKSKQPPKRIPLRYYPWGVAVGDDGGIWVTLRANDGPPRPE